MVDPDRILDRLGRLDRYLELLEEIRGRGKRAFLDDFGLQLQTEHALQLAIQICIDVAAHLVAELGLGAPRDYRGVFTGLYDAGLLDRELAERLARAAGLRNLLVHEYADVDLQQVWAALSRLDDLRRFAAAVEAASR